MFRRHPIEASLDDIFSEATHLMHSDEVIRSTNAEVVPDELPALEQVLAVANLSDDFHGSHHHEWHPEEAQFTHASLALDGMRIALIDWRKDDVTTEALVVDRSQTQEDDLFFVRTNLHSGDFPYSLTYLDASSKTTAQQRSSLLSALHNGRKKASK